MSILHFCAPGGQAIVGHKPTTRICALMFFKNINCLTEMES